jgi:uncharacterized protein
VIMKLRLMAVLSIIAGAAFAADKIPMTFSAVLTTGKERRFGVASPGGTHSSWLSLGGEFEGYKISDYDDDSQTLILQRNGQTFRLPMASGNVQPLSSKATLDDAAAVLAKMNFEQMMKKQLAATISKQMLAQVGAQVPAEEFAAFQVKVTEALSAEMKPEELKNDVAKIYASVFTKEELRGMSDFYATPAGTALIDRQPQVQEKMMDLIMPRMMKAMPRIQEMSTEFTSQQQAKTATGPDGKPKPAPAVKNDAPGTPAPVKKS